MDNNKKINKKKEFEIWLLLILYCTEGKIGYVCFSLNPMNILPLIKLINFVCLRERDSIERNWKMVLLS